MIYIVAKGLSPREMGWAPMRHNNYAVTEILSFIFVVFIVSGATTAILLWGGPAMEQAKTAINLESAFLQLKALSDLVDQVSNQGVGSSQEMNVGTENGNFYFDNLSERVVIYYSICDYDPTARPPGDKPFDFTVVSGFEIGNPNSYSRLFKINISWNPNPAFSRLKYELYKDNDFETPVENVTNLPGLPVPVEYTVGFVNMITDETNTKALIRILGYDPLIPASTKEYGEIWVFDLGSLNYKVGSSQMSKAVVENGGIVEVTSGGYLADEPRYWDKELLNESNMTTLRIINIQPDEVTSIGSIGKFKTKFNVTSEEAQVLEARTKVFSNIKMKMYGDSSVVSAWYNFYNNKMNFGYSGDRSEIFIKILSGGEKPNYMFSLVYDECNIGMEVTS